MEPDSDKTKTMSTWQVYDVHDQVWVSVNDISDAFSDLFLEAALVTDRLYEASQIIKFVSVIEKEPPSWAVFNDRHQKKARRK